MLSGNAKLALLEFAPPNSVSHWQSLAREERGGRVTVCGALQSAPQSPRKSEARRWLKAEGRRLEQHLRLARLTLVAMRLEDETRE